MLKRALDVTGALLGLLLFGPIMLVVAMLIWLSMGPPVLFRQQRPGYRGHPFVILKFRTMREARDHDGRSLSDEARLTPLGRLLRGTSLDELPQLFNVLKGEMSLVGPRPLLIEYLDRYSPEQARRHEVRPGITGWAQVNGRNTLSWEKRFRLDVWYVDHRSVRLDLEILWLTLVKVVRRENIHARGHVTMPEFKGNGQP
jgi:sugar transferase EpsL